MRIYFLDQWSSCFEGTWSWFTLPNSCCHWASRFVEPREEILPNWSIKEASSREEKGRPQGDESKGQGQVLGILFIRTENLSGCSLALCDLLLQVRWVDYVLPSGVMIVTLITLYHCFSYRMNALRAWWFDHVLCIRIDGRWPTWAQLMMFQSIPVAVWIVSHVICFFHRVKFRAWWLDYQMNWFLFLWLLCNFLMEGPKLLTVMFAFRWEFTMPNFQQGKPSKP